MGHKKRLIGFIIDTPPLANSKHQNFGALLTGYKKWKHYFCYSYFPNQDKIMASTQLRVYDVIKNFRDDDFQLEIYKPSRKYDIVIFQKNFGPGALQLATTLKKRGVIIILDINVNYYDIAATTEQQYNEIMKFTLIVDCVICPSQYMCNFIKNLFSQKNVFCIEEHLSASLFEVAKKYSSIDTKKIKFLYSGYAVKAREILLIEEQVKSLARKYLTEYIIIADRDPKLQIDGVKTRFIKYRRYEVHNNLLEGDIFLAPRDLKNNYNLGHSFSKIGQPMAVGVPVIASPIPSYAGSPAILIDDFGDKWSEEIEKLMKNKSYYEEVSKNGVDYCQNNFSTEVIMAKYLKLFNKLIKQQYVVA